MPPRKPTPLPSTPPSTTPQEAIPLIKRQIDRLRDIQSLRFDDPKIDAWLSSTVNILNAVFGQPNGALEQRTQDIKYADGGPMHVGMDDEEIQANHVTRCKNRGALLEAYIEQLQDLSPSNNTSPEEEVPTARSAEACIFLVHGRDNGVKAQVARFLERLGFPPVILHEQPNEGLTIIEKFEKHAARSNFAVILLTADDLGMAKSNEKPSPRARQNVILELGYFMGKLSRKNVCAVYQEGVELPSDYDGVLYVPLDSGDSWQLKLAREIKTAGINVDLNKI